jgi:hypothetical protein
MLGNVEPEETHSADLIATETDYCYSGIRMAKKKTTLKKAVERAAEILLAHFMTLTRAEAKAMRKEIHALAFKSSRTSKRRKSSKPAR